jgi:hypothetical protein
LEVLLPPKHFKINVIEAMLHTWFEAALNIRVISLSPYAIGRYQETYLATIGLDISEFVNKKKKLTAFHSQLMSFVMSLS